MTPEAIANAIRGDTRAWLADLARLTVLYVERRACVSLADDDRARAEDDVLWQLARAYGRGVLDADEAEYRREEATP